MDGRTIEPVGTALSIHHDLPGRIRGGQFVKEMHLLNEKSAKIVHSGNGIDS